jgi:hypothetical protein
VLYWQSARLLLPPSNQFAGSRNVLARSSPPQKLTPRGRSMHTESRRIGIFVIAKVIAFHVLSALMCLYSLSKMLCKSRSIGFGVAQSW